MLNTLKQFITRNIYRKDIFLVLSLKLCALLLLWGFCFSHPIDKTLIRQTISAKLLG